MSDEREKKETEAKVDKNNANMTVPNKESIQKTKDDESKTMSEKDTNKKKSKKKVIFILLAIILVFLLACGGIGAYYYTTENKKISEISKIQENSLQDFSEEIKYGQEISYEDLIGKLVNISELSENTNTTIQINDRELSTEEKFKFDKLGTYTIKVKLDYTYTYSIINRLTQNIESEKTIEIVIEDQEKPVIKGVTNKEITVGDKINLQDGITATDNVDEKVEIKIEGTVDNKKAGKYNIKVIASDKSGNTENATFTVTVKEKTKVTTSTTSNGNSKTNESSTDKSKTSVNSTDSAKTAASSQKYIADILRLTNQYRAEVGVDALTLDSKLSAAAQKRATELVKTPSHTRPNGTSCFTVFNEYGIDAWTYGENIAYGQANGTSAAKWWRNSSGHYKNMTKKEYKKIGIGAYYSGGRWYWVQLFTD